MNFEQIKLQIGADISLLPTPTYIVDERLIRKNLEVLKSVSDRTGCKILLAQKAFSMFSLYPLISQYLAGTAASGLLEARLGYEEMGKFGGEVHTYSPAFKAEDFDEILNYSDHVIFNSLSQYQKFRKHIEQHGKKVEVGLRINPEYTEQEHGIYDPCSEFSRLGAVYASLNEQDFEGIDGIHFHTLCEQNSDVLLRTVEIVMAKFDTYLKKVKWVNFGGGHHITRADYDIDVLCQAIMMAKERYDVEIILEPGEAIALNTGYLSARVLDVLENGMKIAILDASAACHMPDVIEMPYRPHIIGSGRADEKKYTYRLGGPTCLAGDIIGDYSFDEPLKEGDVLLFTDMSHYTMVKNNTFNGMNLPSIASISDEGVACVIKTFGYDDFKQRLS